MFKNYLKIALRNLIKQKLYTIITILGLSIGITCCLLIMLYVKQELSYDRFYPNADRIYRVAHEETTSQKKSYMTATPTPLALALKEENPEVEHITRIYFDAQVLFEYEAKRIFEDNVIFADPDFFQVFPFRILKGDPSSLLDTPDSMVLTASMAKKYFGDEEAIGKFISINKQESFRVTGVIQDVPVNSHFHFDVVLSFLAKNEQNFGTWLNLWTGYTTLYTYAVLPENLNVEEFTSRVENIITEHSEERPGVTRKIFFQPLKSIHLYSHFEDEIEQNNFVSNLIILSTIAFLILIIACINYMNLATAQSEKRAKEVGMRKVLGAERLQLVKQFTGESILLTLLAVFLSLVLVEIFLSTFSSLVGKPVRFIYGENLFFLVGFFVLAIVIGAISSVYPAVFLSRHQPAVTLKGLKDSPRRSPGQLWFKKALVVIQFVVSILLIICTLIINQQLRYMRNARLGFDKEHTVVFPLLSDSARNQYETIKNELMTHANVVGATACFRSPIGDNVLMTRAFPKGREDGTNFSIYINSIDYDFIDNFGIEMAAGRNFSKKYSTDAKNAFIVNEATVREIGFASPAEAIGKKLLIGFYGVEGTIMGVTKDHHISSLHEEIEPLVMIHTPQFFYSMAVKISSDNIPQTLSFIEKTWSKFIPEFPFTYSFLDEYIDRLYKGDEQTARIVRTFSVIAVFIACLGLFGLATFAAERRTKEIGIRKVLGATSSNITFLLSTEFTKWVLVANIIAWPIAYYAMNRWLQGFAYRINIGIWSFVLSAVMAFVIALLTVSYQSVKAAIANPVESLRYE
jgi:putative ABC transport system permease protein